MGNSPAPDDVRRSYIMSRVKSKNTSIEVSLRKALWRSGIRYRKNYPDLPGTPDIVITKHHIVIFCDGEFWHGWDWENKRSKIRNNREYWIKKIERNMDRDRETDRRLRGLGWTVIRFWGSEIRKDINRCVKEIEDEIFYKMIMQHNYQNDCAYDFDEETAPPPKY